MVKEVPQISQELIARIAETGLKYYGKSPRNFLFIAQRCKNITIKI
jgi:hypothetical protein